MLLRVTRPERPWAVCAVLLLFVLVTVYDAKNNPRMRAPSLQQQQQQVGTVYVKRLGDNDDTDDDNDNDVNSPVTTPLADVPVTDFNFCTLPHVQITGDNKRTIDIPYQCDGPLYRSFIGQLRTFSDDLVTMGDQTPAWGHRHSLPPNKRYLFLGNSHTRQTCMALLCQLHNVSHTESLEPTNKAMARRYDLDHGTQIYLVVNSFVVHSPQWASLLEKQIGVALKDFDAIILGLFNTCNNADANTTFAKDMKELQDEESGVDCINQDGPTLAQVAAEYSGPLAYVSMFATYRYKTYSQDRDDAKVLHAAGRSNLAYLDARQYLRMYELEECGSANRDALSDCVHGEEARRYHHRCVGRFGGHPDLIAWDVVEFLYKHTAA